MNNSDIAGFSCLLMLASTIGGCIGGAVLAGVLCQPPAGERCGMAVFPYAFAVILAGVIGLIVGALGGVCLSAIVVVVGRSKNYEQE